MEKSNKGIVNASSVAAIASALFCFCVSYIYDKDLLVGQISIGLFVVLAAASIIALLLSKSGEKGSIKDVMTDRTLDRVAIFTLVLIFLKGVIPTDNAFIISIIALAIGWIIAIGGFFKANKKTNKVIMALAYAVAIMLPIVAYWLCLDGMALSGQWKIFNCSLIASLSIVVIAKIHVRLSEKKKA